jgi:hypothetical protein
MINSAQVGEVLLTWWDDPLIPGRRAVRIDRADPTCWLRDELLADLTAEAHKRLNAGLTVDEPLDGMGQPSDGISYNPEHQALTIKGRDLQRRPKTVIYRITETYDPKHNAWLAAWPD